MGALVWAMGCAQGSFGDQEEPPVTIDNSCERDEECDPGLRCNVVAQECIRVTPPVMPPNNMMPSNNMTTPPGNNTSTPDMGMDADMRQPMDDMGMKEDMRMEPDMRDPSSCFPECGMGEKCEAGTCVPDVLTCSPACGTNEECMQGTCVPVQTGVCSPSCPDTQTCESGSCVPATCNPGCESNGTCTVNGCVYPTCSVEGDACDANTTAQGNFYCLVSAADNRAQCYSKCPDANTSTGCGTAQRCLAPLTSDPSITICLDSECSVNSDCNEGAQTGTCLKFENSWGACTLAGSVQVGGSCNPGASQNCVQGAVCDRASGQASGVCAKACDPWNATACAGNEYCNLYTTRTGVCAANQDSLGTAVYEPCATPGNYCADATLCVDVGADNICYQYCRGDAQDCDTGLACNNYLFAGDRALGICDANCSNNPGICPADSDCISDLCRARCTAASDCCQAGQPCEWQCVGGYCE